MAEQWLELYSSPPEQLATDITLQDVGPDFGSVYASALLALSAEPDPAPLQTPSGEEMAASLFPAVNLSDFDLEPSPPSEGSSESSIFSELFDGIDLYDLDYQIVFGGLRDYWNKHHHYLEHVALLETASPRKRVFYEAWYSIVRMYRISEDAKHILDNMQPENPHSQALDEMLELAYRWLNDPTHGMEWCLKTALGFAESVLPRHLFPNPTMDFEPSA